MRIVDCFPYFNEKELLELRINLLQNVVDKFIIVDADHTHKGDPKPFTCKNTLKELGLLSDKIQVIELNLPSYSEESDSWVRERMQRNAASGYLEDGDVCIVSDCDEIINPEFVQYYANVARNHPNNILRIPMIFLIGRGDLRVHNENNQPVEWNTPYICLKEHLNKYTLSDIREAHALSKGNLDYPDIYTTENGRIEEAGWHFSWMGDSQRIKNKSISFLHWNEFNILENYIPEENSTDPLGRQNHILKKYPVNLLPQKIFQLENVKNFLFQSSSKDKTGITAKNLSFVNTNHHLAFDYLKSKFDITEKNYRVIDIGAGANPWSIDLVTHVADKFVDPKDVESVSKNNIQVFNLDVDDPRDWNVLLDDVEKNGKFDFVMCTHVLEDINNPKIACEMINRIGKAGFISMPSKYAEMVVFENKSNCNLPYRGYHHHRWIYQIKNNVLIGHPKMNFHDYIQFDFDQTKGYATEIAFLWEGNFEYEFLDPHQMLDNRVGPNRLYDLFQDDDLVL